MLVLQLLFRHRKNWQAFLVVSEINVLLNFGKIFLRSLILGEWAQRSLLQRSLLRIRRNSWLIITNRNSLLHCQGFQQVCLITFSSWYTCVLPFQVPSSTNPIIQTARQRPMFLNLALALAEYVLRVTWILSLKRLHIKFKFPLRLLILTSIIFQLILLFNLISIKQFNLDWQLIGIVAHLRLIHIYRLVNLGFTVHANTVQLADLTQLWVVLTRGLVVLVSTTVVEILKNGLLFVLWINLGYFVILKKVRRRLLFRFVLLGINCVKNVLLMLNFAWVIFEINLWELNEILISF